MFVPYFKTRGSYPSFYLEERLIKIQCHVPAFRGWLESNCRQWVVMLNY